MLISGTPDMTQLIPVVFFPKMHIPSVITANPMEGQPAKHLTGVTVKVMRDKERPNNSLRLETKGT